MDSFECKACSEKFESRNKLFKHLTYNCKEKEKEKALKKKVDDYGVKIEDKMVIVVANEEDYMVVIKPQGFLTIGKGKISLSSRDELLYLSSSRKDSKVSKDAYRAERINKAEEKKLLLGGKEQMRRRKAVCCHRLDAATGGLLLCSKGKDAERHIRESFRFRLVHKRYRAIVVGKFGEDETHSGLISSPIDGKPSLTKYQVIEHTPSKRYGYVTTVDLFPITGRRHQLRKHLKSIGYPILGDPKYSLSTTWPSEADNLFLWSLEISFPDPKLAHPSILLDTVVKGESNIANGDKHTKEKQEKDIEKDGKDKMGVKDIEKEEEEEEEREDKTQNFPNDDEEEEDDDLLSKLTEEEYMNYLLLLYKKTSHLPNYIKHTISEPLFYGQFRSIMRDSVINDSDGGKDIK